MSSLNRKSIKIWSSTYASPSRCPYDPFTIAKVPRSHLSNSPLNPSSSLKETHDGEDAASKRRRTRSSGSSDLEKGLPYKPSPRRAIRPQLSPSAWHTLSGRFRPELSHSYHTDSPNSGSSQYSVSSDYSINYG